MSSSSFDDLFLDLRLEVDSLIDDWFEVCDLLFPLDTTMGFLFLRDTVEEALEEGASSLMSDFFANGPLRGPLLEASTKEG